MIDSRVAIQLHRELPRGDTLFGFNLLAILIPIAQPDEFIENAALFQFGVEAVTEGTSLVATGNAFGRLALYFHP